MMDGLRIDISQLNSSMGSLSPKLTSALLMYMSTKSAQIQAKMKMKRPWTDRTGMAKMMLSAKPNHPNEFTFQIILAHGVDYGIWLELANEKKYAILMPTINEEGPKMVSGLTNFLDKIKL